MKVGKKIFVGIYVCLFALTITLSGVIIGFSALNGDFSSQFEVNYYTTPEILSDDYGYYVEMGEYPQTFAGYTSDVTFTDSGEDFTYVAKDGTTATADVYTDSSGNRYIIYTVAAYSTDYTFLDGTATASGDAYFKIEPIKWRILGYYEDSAYTNALVDDTAVFVQVTSASDENYNALASHRDAIVVQSELALEGVEWNNTNLDVDYPNSTIYSWLENFYSEILSDYDSYISYRTIDYNDTGNTSSSDYDTGAMTTSEKIWLLSYTEAITYYSNTTGVSSDRCCSPSDFGLATYCDMTSSYTSTYRTGTTIWWLRTSYLNVAYFDARFVAYGGSISGHGANAVFNAVRPAMLLNLSSEDDSGSGSASTVEILSDDYGYYVEMGEYPQTFLGYTSDVTDLTDSGEDFIYVARNGTTATADVYTDSSGNRYIIYTVAANSTEYTFLDGTATASGDAYFKLEPIKWRILGYYEDSAYTNAVVDSMASFVQVTSVSDENYNSLVAHSDAIVVQSELGLESVAWYTSNSDDVDYPNSTIYNWLENFYSTILLGYDSYISYRTIDYNDTSEHTSGEDYVDATVDEKIWLLSYTEAMTYYSSTASNSADRLCSPSDFGLATHCTMNTSYTSTYRTGTTYWWLRSSFQNSSGTYCARYVYDYGVLAYAHVNNSISAVRPAMLLNLSGTDTSATATSVSSGDGSGSVGERLLNSSDSIETAILTTTSALDKRRLVMYVEN